MKILSISHKMRKGSLDDDYTLFENGDVLHEYDKSIYPGGQNYSDTYKVNQLSMEIKQRLLDASSDENRELVRNILGMD